MEKLPTEILLMIAERLSKIDLLNLHAVSKTLFFVTDRSFADYFFSLQILFMTNRSLARLDAISKHSTYRNSINEIRLSTWHVQPDAGVQRRSDSSTCQCGKSEESGPASVRGKYIADQHQALLESGEAVAIISGILTRLKSCHRVSIGTRLHPSCANGHALPYCHRSLRAQARHHLFGIHEGSSTGRLFVQRVLSVAESAIARSAVSAGCAVTTLVTETNPGPHEGIEPQMLFQIHLPEPTISFISALEIAASSWLRDGSDFSDCVKIFSKGFANLRRLTVTFQPRLERGPPPKNLNILLNHAIETTSLCSLNYSPDDFRRLITTQARQEFEGSSSGHSD